MIDCLLFMVCIMSAMCFFWGLFGIHVAPFWRFELDSKEMCYKYQKGKPFLYIRKSKDWFPLEKKVNGWLEATMFLDFRRISCKLTLDPYRVYNRDMTPELEKAKRGIEEIEIPRGSLYQIRSAVVKSLQEIAPEIEKQGVNIEEVVLHCGGFKEIPIPSAFWR